MTISMLAPEIQGIYDSFSRPEQDVFDTIVQVAYQVNPSFQNRIQWKKPTFTLNDNWHHWIFSLTKTKLGMTLSFHKGWLLDDPEKVLTGDGAHLRMLRFSDPNEISRDTLANLIRSAIQHQLDM